MVLKVLSAFAAIAKVRYSHTPVDSHVFRLHYRWTTTFCFACCALVAAKEFIGGNIKCMSSDIKNLKPATTYCWISTTFTLNSTTGLGTQSDGDKPRYHSYYQWVPVVLFIQGCLFYVPHMIWKWFEGKQVDKLLQGLNKGLFDEDREKKIKNIVSYLRESWGLNMRYGVIYHVCEFLNLVVVLAQMYAIDKFLGGAFWQYGSQVLGLVITMDERWYDALATVFPRLTKCTFKKFGFGGKIQDFDLLCLLPQNIINEKIYLVMWVWFVVLAILTAVWVTWRALVLMCPPVRQWLLELLMDSKMTEKMEQTVRSLNLGDFCLLETIGYNLDIFKFKEVLEGITDAVEEYDPSAPMLGGTYKPFQKPDDNVDVLQHRFAGRLDNVL